MRKLRAGAVVAAVSVSFIALPALPPVESGAAPRSAVNSALDSPAPSARRSGTATRAPRAERADRSLPRADLATRCVDAAPDVRGRQALATLRPQWRSSGVDVRFSAERAGVLGETLRHSGDVMVFVRPCAAEPTALLRHVLAHELGHAWDVTRLSPAQRLAYKRARGIPVRTPWFGCSGCSDFATPAGDFAETYALWLRQGSATRSELAPTPTPAELASLADRFFGG